MENRFEVAVTTKHGLTTREFTDALREALTARGYHPSAIVVDDEPLHHREEREEIENADQD